MLNDQPTMRKLQIEIAITIDAMEAFVKATYNLEGDGHSLYLHNMKKFANYLQLYRLNTIPMLLLL